MSYIIYTSSGTVLTTIATGKINTVTTSITLVGRDVSNYGKYINQNFVDILSNFANNSSTPPENPLQGQLWFDTTYNKLRVYNDIGFELVGVAQISPTQPIGQQPGEFWFESDTERRGLNFLDDEGQYQTVTSFPRNNISGWQHPIVPIYDNSPANNVKEVPLLKSYGEVVGALSTSSFIASVEDSTSTFVTANTSSFAIADGLTIIGDIKSTGGLISGRTPPLHNTSSGTPGEIAIDSSYLYVCVATDSWKRIALTSSTW